MNDSVTVSLFSKWILVFLISSKRQVCCQINGPYQKSQCQPHHEFSVVVQILVLRAWTQNQCPILLGERGKDLNHRRCSLSYTEELYQTKYLPPRAAIDLPRLYPVLCQCCAFKFLIVVVFLFKHPKIAFVDTKKAQGMM